ncbi:hypothetical protein D3C81_1214860 [compost metagenome]
MSLPTGATLSWLRSSAGATGAGRCSCRSAPTGARPKSGAATSLNAAMYSSRGATLSAGNATPWDTAAVATGATGAADAGA